MSTWRDRASPQAQEDLDGLVSFALPLAQEMLDDAGEFYPFGASVDDHDSVHLIQGGPDLGAHPTSAQVLGVLVAGMRTERARLRATAIVSDVRLEHTDAVRVELEHRDGQAVEIYLPYRPRRFRRGVDYDDRTETSGTHRVWT